MLLKGQEFMKKNILNELGKRIVFFDGGMGTLLQERGLEAGELPENWNLKHPDIIRELHRDYLNAGADIILANTFGANELKLITRNSSCALGSGLYSSSLIIFK